MFSIFLWCGHVYLCFVYFPCGSSVFPSVLFWCGYLFMFLYFILSPDDTFLGGRVLGPVFPHAIAADTVLARGYQICVLVDGAVSSSYRILGCCALVEDVLGFGIGPC